MKTFNFLFFCTLFAFSFQINAISKEEFNKENSSFAIKSIRFYNELLGDQHAIESLNLYRPDIYIYTDFGGGKNLTSPLHDLQSSGEISSAAWKSTLQQKLYINDSAKALSPYDAALHLATTFPYEETKQEKSSISKIVVHVIDPGVGNVQDINPEPRSIVLRKDGVIFIGPDNGTLSFVCPSGSIKRIWEINTNKITHLSGIDLEAGGTFHGRDLFSEAAFLLAAGIVSLDEIGIPYDKLELRNVFRNGGNLPEKPIEFVAINTDRFELKVDYLSQNDRIEKAFLLGAIQSSLYDDDHVTVLTLAKKIFIIKSPEENRIAIVNHKTQNIFIGPNNGLGTSFFKGYPQEAVETFQISPEIFEKILQEENSEAIFSLLKLQPLLSKPLVEIDFLGDEKSLVRDKEGRPQKLLARIWLDSFGSIKTTAQSTLFNEVKNLKGQVKVVLNNIEAKAIFADTFSEVKKEQLFVYNGSTSVFGSNPHRSRRYVELSSNGVYGKFGVDFFKKDGKLPESGELVWFYFNYVE